MRVVPTVLLALACAAPAQAKVVEIGRTDARPTCPGSPCLAISRTTGYQARVATGRGQFTVPADGKIVAWSIALGKPTAGQKRFFESSLGGPPRAGLTVLRQGPRLFNRVVTRSPVVNLEPYLGQTVQFPLGRALNVRRGYVIALTVPTWAPALTPVLQDGSAWRASRARGACADTGTQTAQRRFGALAQYRCLYKARLSYSATLVTRPASAG